MAELPSSWRWRSLADRDGFRGGLADDPIEQRRCVPAQEVEAAPDAVAGGRQDGLERDDARCEEPCEARCAERQERRCGAEEERAQHLGEPRRDLRLELARRPEPED